MYPALLLAAPLLLGDSVRFAPEREATVTKTFTQTAKLESTLAEVALDGDDDVPTIDLSFSWERTLGFTDTYLESEEGRPTKLRRDFDDMEHEVDFHLTIAADGFDLDEEGAATGESGLADTAVVFTREGEGETVEWVEDEEGDDGLLEGLRMDADLTGFLPQGDVDSGDRWDVDGSALVALLVPGGDPGFEMSYGEQRQMEPTAVGLEPAFYSLFEHMLGDPDPVDATATYRGTRDAGGRRVAVIELEVDFEAARDVSAAMDPWMDPVRGEEGMELEIALADAAIGLEAEGELLWDLEAGRVHSFELSGEVVIGLVRHLSIGMGGEEMNATLDIELEGELSVALVTE